MTIPPALEVRDVLVILAVGAVTVAIVVAVFWAAGTIDGDQASKVIIACVGGSAISSVAAALLKRKN